MLQAFLDKMNQPVHAITLGLFRIFFACVGIIEGLRIFKAIPHHYSEDGIRFSFNFLPKLPLLPELGLYLVSLLVIIGAIGLLIGWRFRRFLVLFLICYLYFFMVDVAHYNNHYYAVLLLGVLLLITNANYWGSLGFKKSNYVPSWQLAILKFQIIVIYFYGGITKLNKDWISGNVMRFVLEEKHLYLDYSFLYTEQAVLFFTWGGLLFDLFIGVLLLKNATRKSAFAVLILFNLSNWFLFRVGVFPFMNIALAIIFFSPNNVQWLFQKLGYSFSKETISKSAELKPQTMALLICFIAIQLLLPFRHHLIKGDVNWTGEGKRFAWRMKMPAKKVESLEIHVYNKLTQEEYQNLYLELSEDHLFSLAYYPYLILDVKEYLLEKYFSMEERATISMYASMKIRMNGGPIQEMYQELDLMICQSVVLGHHSFLNEYHE